MNDAQPPLICGYMASRIHNHISMGDVLQKAILLIGILSSLSSCTAITKAPSDPATSVQAAVGTVGQGTSRESSSGTTQYVSSQNANQATPASIQSQWKPEVFAIAGNVSYLTQTERQVIVEINMVRSDPVQYARTYLEPLRSFYNGNLLEYPGQITIVTQEGLAALDECIRVLESTMPVVPLSPKEGLAQAARDQANFQARTGEIGHAGSAGSSPEMRVSRYGSWGIAFGENIDYGNSQARRIVTSMLIDDGVPSRGHRINLLDSKFKYIGVAVGPHPQYGHMCVMDFAGSYN